MPIRDTNNIPKLAANINSIINRVAEKVGAFAEAKVIDRINDQDSRWQPLSKKYLEWKKKHGKSELTWVQTGELRLLITYRVIVEGNETNVQVGIFDHEKGFIAHILEFGTSDGDIPERPLFRPVFDENIEELEKKIKEWFSEEIHWRSLIYDT